MAEVHTATPAAVEAPAAVAADSVAAVDAAAVAVAVDADKQTNRSI